ncbi:SatD family protein [Flavimarina sp. Hel_I_48]|uniref:SatD family protein n=1 Tax=Flavimarina sp. Hel_I_48 TaxID=1392488 RepID=UPI0004DED37B|nr:SatD family protein [Flavimarina sp. Hel_I_48]
MRAILTGDIINSREGEVGAWINYLKETLDQYGTEPTDWELYRGDSFQLALDPENALVAAMHIKAAIKQTKSQDVRIAIGIGEEAYSPMKITEANGSAYVRSGECFETLKKQTLAIRSDQEHMDKPVNIMLGLALLVADHWSGTVAEVIKTTIENPKKNQKTIAKMLDKSQSNISEALKRGGFEEIMSLNDYYKAQIAQL